MKFITPDWPAPACIKAYTTLRSGWEGPFQENSWELLKTLLQLPSDPIWVEQTHSAIAIEAIPAHQAQIADATFSAKPNHICVILTADCLPILICNQQGTEVAAIHAGWRGLANGIIEATLKALPFPKDELLVWLGPAIGQQKFEVGQDVYDAFTSQQPESAAAFTPYRPGKWLANLYQLATLRLNRAGISQIYGGQYCTHTQADLFFSYRRDQGITGRMASTIWISGQ